MTTNEKLTLLLFVNKNWTDTQLKTAKLKNILSEKFNGNYDLKVLDIFDNWEQAKAANVKVTPTLFKSHPPPITRIALTNIDEAKELLSLLE